MNSKFVVAVACASLLSAACQTLPPRLPERRPVPTPPSQMSSVATARVSVAYSDIVRDLSNHVPPRFVDQPIDIPGSRGCRADVVGDRDGFVLTGSGQDVRLSANFNISLKVIGDRKKPWCRGRANATGTLWADSRLAISQKWKFQSNTTVDFNLSAAHICIVGCISVRTLLSSLIRDKVEGIGGKFDQVLSEVDLRTPAGRGWAALATPVSLTSSPQSWFLIAPQEAAIRPIFNENSRIGVVASVIGPTSITVQPQVPPQTPSPLPDLIVRPDLPDRFAVRIRAGLPLLEATRILRGELVGRSFDIGGSSSLSVQDAQVHPHGDRILISVDVSITTPWLPAIRKGARPYINGRIYFWGTPRYDMTASTIYIDDFDFDPVTRDVLVRAANWLLHSKVLENIRPKLKTDLTQEFERQRSTLSGMLGGTDLSPNIRLIGQVDELGVSSVFLTEDAIVIDAYAGGTASVEVRP